MLPYGIEKCVHSARCLHQIADRGASWVPRPSEASVDVLGRAEDNAPYRDNAYTVRVVCIFLVGTGVLDGPRAFNERPYKAIAYIT